MKRTLSAFTAGILQHLGLLTAFVLLVAAHEFVDAHPALTAVLVFIFSMPYLVAAVVARRASFLYGTMLLGAVAYFLACHALGAPGTLFPLLSVPLVWCLLIVGHVLRKRLDAEMAAYPTTVFRAMDITVAAFAIWALIQVGGLMGTPGYMQYAAGLAFLGYAGLYLAHSLAGASPIYIHAFSICLMLGAVFTVAAAVSFQACWAAAIASAGAVLAVGTKLHRGRTHAWSWHFYVSSAVVIAVSLALSVVRGAYLVVDLSLASLLLWAAYRWLARAVPDVRHAMLAERVMAKCFFFGSLGLGVLVVPAMLLWPADPHIALAALICGVTFAWMMWRRRDQVFGTRGVYSLAAVMFASAGLLGLGRQLPAWLASAWSAAVPLALLIGLGLLRGAFDREKDKVIRRTLAEAAVFPAFFVWFIPLLQGETIVALAGAAAAAVMVAAESVQLKEKAFRHALGPAVAGIFVAATYLLAGPGSAAWIACAAGAAVAGVGYLLAVARERQATRGALHLAWLILSAAGLAFAVGAGSADVLYSLTAIAAVSVLMTGFLAAQAKRGVQYLAVAAVAVLAVAGSLVWGPFSELRVAWPGVCLLVLSAACWLAWARGRGIWTVRAATGLLSLGSLLVIFNVFATPAAQLGAGAGVVGALFVLAALLRGRFPRVSNSAVITGHLTSIILASAALIQCWPQNSWVVPAIAAALAAIYAVMPRLRTSLGFRSGIFLWLSVAVLLGMAALAGKPYRAQLPTAAFLSLVWLAVGYTWRRAEAWSMPLYVAAAFFAGLCGLVGLFTPAPTGVWSVFLVNGVAFMGLFLVLREDVFVYLSTLSLSVLAYTWVKTTSSFFTQDVLFYLILGAAVLGVVFWLPHLKRLLTKTGSLPIFSIFSWQGKFLLAIPITALALLVVMAYTTTLTGHPKFCVSCHNMDEYYVSWQHSSHQDVACIDCHYNPGAAAMVKGKLSGLVQVVQYVSHSYSTKPHALVSNDSCMRSSCHAGMGETADVVLFGDQIKFRHDKHLSGNPRGKMLNCVSCHGHTEKAEHINVVRTACLTCHFYGRADDTPLAAAQCDTCHTPPAETVTFMGQSFDHVSFLKGKTAVGCENCHSQVTRGDGAVSAVRCRSCHVEKPFEVKDQEQFHLVHVSEESVDCLQCHDEIKHGIPPKEQQLLAFGDCKSCHVGERHSLQESMYAGTGIPATKGQADPMYKARVGCNGCHTDVRSASLGKMPFTMKGAGQKQCVDCHGNKNYGKMLVNWQELTKERLGELRTELATLDKACQSAKDDAPAGEFTKAQAMLEAMRTTLSYIEKDGSYGAHNNAYVSDALDSVEDELAECEELTDGWKKIAVRSPMR